MLTTTTRQDAFKTTKLIEIDGDQVLVHDSLNGKDIIITLVLDPKKYPGVSLAELQAQTEKVAREHNIPVRRRPRL